MRALDAMSRLPPFVVLALVPALSLSQTADSSQQQRTLRGEVVNSVTGQPIPGALVDMGGQHAVLTDREGQFEFPNLTGNYGGAAATKPGYFPDQGIAIDTTSASQENRAITLKLVPEAILSGTIVDQNAQPLEGLQVQLKIQEVRNGLRRWQMARSTTTNVEGEFRFADLQAGKYSLSTAFQIEGLPDAPTSIGFAPVTYPPSSGEEEAALTLAAGDHIEANLNPPSEKLYAVTGRVDGPPAQGVNFAAESSGGKISPDLRFNQATGQFRLLLPGGSYRLTLHAYAAEGQFFGTREISVTGAPLRDISIPLAPLAVIPVEVEFQSINPSSQVTQLPQPFFPNIWLENTDPSGSPESFNAQLPQGSPGRIPQPGDPLAINNLEPGHYRLQARPQPPWYLESAFCGGLDLMREPLAIAGSAAGCTLHAVLRNDSSTLTWSINSHDHASPSGMVFVYALPLGNSTQPLSAGNAQPQTAGSAQGSFEGLAPGRYLVMAFDRPQELAYGEADAVQHYLPLGKEVALTPNGEAEVQLDVVTGEP
jgi:hypothetical protein